jgi:hypothetical protein
VNWLVKLRVAGLIIALGFPVYMAVEVKGNLQEQMGKVKGVVLDPTGARLVHAKVVLQNEQIRKEVMSNDGGEYEVAIPSGIYDISAEVRNYYTFQRARFHVEPGKTTIINVAPHLRLSGVVLDIWKGDVASLAAPPKYERISPPNSVIGSLELVLSFREKTIVGRTASYRSSTASYDALTIYADEIVVDRNNFRLEASGKVLIEDGTQSMRCRRATADLRAHTVSITVDF